MRLIILCGSLEPGRDGVGDYSRKLAGGLILQGHAVSVISINDKYLSDAWSGEQEDNDTNIPTIRLPAVLDWKAKVSRLEQYVREFNPDWLSLQYVSYAYHAKGVPLKMIMDTGSLLKKTKLQIMFHELWLGGRKRASLKWKFWGFFQKGVIRLLLKTTMPKVIQTSIPLYQQIMMKAGINASVLPIFSNISNLHLPYESYSSQIPGWLVKSRQQYSIGCNFGSFYNESWDFSNLLPAFAAECKKIGKIPLIFSIGKISSGEEAWKGLAARYPEIRFLTVGACSPELLSYWFSWFTDFGMITTPAFIAGKSGSFMAFKEHGLRCFCKENDLEFDFETGDIAIDENLILIKFESDFYLPERKLPINQLNETIKLFSNSLNISQ